MNPPPNCQQRPWEVQLDGTHTQYGDAPACAYWALYGGTRLRGYEHQMAISANSDGPPSVSRGGYVLVRSDSAAESNDGALFARFGNEAGGPGAGFRIVCSVAEAALPGEHHR